MNPKIYATFIVVLSITCNSLNAQNTFPLTGRTGVYTTSPVTSLQVKGGARIGTTANYVNIDSATGSLTFAGTGVYKVAGNKYAFQYTANPNYGLFFNSSSVQYEFRNGSAVPVFSINANTGNSVFNGTVKIGAYTLPSTDGTSGQALTTNGSGTVSWSNVSGSSGANTSLSNLAATTAINAGLLPRTDNSISLGSSGKGWANIYIDSALYMGGTKFLTGNASSGNTGVGLYTLSANTGSANVATGEYALYSNTTGNSNTANGYDALYYNTTGNYNTANGYEALNDNTTGSDNTANGYAALPYNTTGSYNTATGNHALYYNTTGSDNTANGYEALYLNTTGNNNIATGNYALYNNTTGSDNTVNGMEALQFNTTGNYNTANGFEALDYNTTGSDNTANGFLALASNTTGSYNTVNGYEALFFNTTGSNNTANGYVALFSNTTGNYNTANGYQALNSNTTGFQNTANGFEALYYNTTGNNNTALGDYAYPIDGTVSNYTGMGYGVGSSASTSNEVEIGNSSVSIIRGEVNFSTYSDKRIKNNIQQNVPGLAFINKLTPVTYKLDIHKENDMMYAGKTINGKSEKDVDFAGKYDLEKKQMTGFLAQDVEAAAEAVHYDFSGVVKPRNEHDLYSLRYSDFVVPLVKAVQELSGQNDSLKQNNQSLNTKVNALEDEVSQLKTLVLSIQQQQQNCNPCSATANKASVTQSYTTLSDGASLEQNIPNPFNSTTSIGYTLPQKFTNAQIVITDKNAKTLKAVTISGSGKGSLNVNASTLSSGAYQYSLIVDGKLIGTKQMVLAK